VAEVYLARHKLLDRIVAVKIISPAKAGDLADKRFLKEAKVVAGLRHPNIVSIYDVGVLENKYYIIMEYLDKGDLKQHSKKGLSIAKSFEILKQVGSALAHAHDKGFIHRDIKSQNVMFRNDGSAVLTDFGIVKDLTVDTGYTLDGTSVGTPHYMSPEQAQGSSDIDWRTDLYSLGVTFYEMLTGTVPYSADTPVAVALKHIRAPVPRLPEHLARYQFFIDRLMAKKPEKRFQSAYELVEALDRQAVPDNEDTQTETIAYTDRTALRLNRGNSGIKFLYLAIALAVVAVIAGFAILGHWDWMQQEKRSSTSQSDTDFASGSGKTVELKPPDENDVLEGPATSSISGQERRAADSPGKSGGTEKAMSIDARLLSQTFKNGNYQAARDYIVTLRGQLPPASGEKVQKADAFRENGQLLAAAAAYHGILSMDSQNQLALLGLLSVAAQKQQALEAGESSSVAEYAEHLAFLEKSIENTHAVAFKQLKHNTLAQLNAAGRNLFSSGHSERAHEMAQIGLEHAPDHLPLKKLALLCQARMHFEENRLTVPPGDNALAYYQQVLELDPQDPDAAAGIERIENWYLREARKAYKAHNNDRALQYITRARSLKASAATDKGEQLLEWMIRGDRHYESGQYLAPENKNARYYYQKILKQDPGNEEIALKLAKAEVLGPLNEINKESALKSNLPYFRQALHCLETAVSAHGSEALADVQKTVAERIQTVIDTSHASRKEIPDTFINLVETHFSEFDDIFNARYEALLAKGDEQDTLQEQADFYLKALKRYPERPLARKKIEAVTRAMVDAGDPNQAAAALKQAMAVAPDHSGFQEFLQTLQAARDAKADLFTQLYQIKLIQPFSKKIESYRKFFFALESASARHGWEEMQDPRQEAKGQVKADISARKADNRLLPENFVEMVTNYLPELEKFILNAQYDILTNKAENAVSLSEKADYYMAALKLNPNRATASGGIREMARRIDDNGNNQDAVAMLERAMAVAPSNGMIAEFYEKIHTEIEIFPTNSGCGKENRISEAPVTIETLNLCLQYRNMSPNSIVHVVLIQDGGQSMEIPVVLDARDGSRTIQVHTPVEGFSTGSYLIAVKQNDRTLQESRIQFLPKRR